MDKDQIFLGLSHPQLLLRKAFQAYNYRNAGKQFNTSGEKIIDKDWDNLIILDACRYDLFKEENTISGHLSSIESRGSATPEFLLGNFHEEDLLDTVYITSNPMLYRHQEDIQVTFHDIINLWTGDTWDDEHETVLPETVTAQAKKVAREYPHKRLLIHYMQPHYPFIESDTTFDKGHIGEDGPEDLTTWMQVLTGDVDISKNDLWKAYMDNLRRALPYVEDLANHLDGKTVISSDHGNMFGEKVSLLPVHEWGHPPGIWSEELVKVPWLETPADTRKQITSEPKRRNSSSEDSVTVDERLKSLGYK